MKPPLPEYLIQNIWDDLKSDRYKSGNRSLEEIAAIRLGDKKKGGTISKIEKRNNIQLRKQGRTRHIFRQNHSIKEPQSRTPTEVECFEPENCLSLIDEAITSHKSILSEVTDPYKMDKWSAALERLLEQRRTE